MLRRFSGRRRPHPHLPHCHCERDRTDTNFGVYGRALLSGYAGRYRSSRGIAAAATSLENNSGPVSGSPSPLYRLSLRQTDCEVGKQGKFDIGGIGG